MLCPHRGKFEDEITRDLKHTGAGIVSMVRVYEAYFFLVCRSKRPLKSTWCAAILPFSPTHMSASFSDLTLFLQGGVPLFVLRCITISLPLGALRYPRRPPFASFLYRYVPLALHCLRFSLGHPLDCTSHSVLIHPPPFPLNFSHGSLGQCGT